MGLHLGVQILRRNIVQSHIAVFLLSYHLLRFLRTFWVFWLGFFTLFLLLLFLLFFLLTNKSIDDIGTILLVDDLFALRTKLLSNTCSSLDQAINSLTDSFS